MARRLRSLARDTQDVSDLVTSLMLAQKEALTAQDIQTAQKLDPILQSLLDLARLNEVLAQGTGAGNACMETVQLSATRGLIEGAPTEATTSDGSVDLF
ncbi:MAG: hypothetical protein AAFQ19_01460 [Pseudomonadota bacterium]